MLFPQYSSFLVVLCPLLNLTVFLPLRVQSFVKRCNNCPLHKLFRYSLFVTSLVLLSSILIFFRCSLPFVKLNSFSAFASLVFYLKVKQLSLAQTLQRLPVCRECYRLIFILPPWLIFFLDHSFLAPEGKYPRGVRDAFIELVSSLFTGRG